ncbi:DUF4861 family protein [Flavobacterium algicola]|uniref:DUF4861 family protein n=1 Tax=Flavobacterium algicola TaxID=556529 RepID=UPI001EFEEAE5|nr:DUF4861 family protein [Flavobacterium algicola]MCG9792255.1 DUF4861 domain-containing protein [Flavobacterium algicola]
MLKIAKLKFFTSLCCFFSMICVLQANTSIKEQTVSIQNKSKFNYVDKVVSISWEKIKEKNPSIDSENLKIVDAQSQNEITYQFEYTTSKQIQNLLVQVSLMSGQKLKLVFMAAKHGDFVVKTFGRYVPERLDDFAWENDKIAFRMYGKALESTPKDNAFGTDVWVKRTDRMILNERYGRNEYHKDHGDGMDYYHVGYTLGAGGIAPFINDSIYYSKNYSKWKMLENGPLRTKFELEYDSWDAAGVKLTLVKTISLDAGSQLSKIDVHYKYNDDMKQLPVVIGIIKRPEAGADLLNRKKGILGYWEPQHGEDGTTGVGVIIPTKVDNMQIRNGQYLATVTIPKGESFTYYSGAAWDKAGEITNSEQWFAHLSEEREKIVKDKLKISF